VQAEVAAEEAEDEVEASELVDVLVEDEVSVDPAVLDVDEEDAGVHSTFEIIYAWLLVVIPPA
jgi:hypothetical protein